MKSRTLMCIAAIGLFAVLSTSLRFHMSAQEERAQQPTKVQHYRKLQRLRITAVGARRLAAGSPATQSPDFCYPSCRHTGYCELELNTKGQLVTDGGCVSHSYGGFCDIQASAACPSGANGKDPSFTTCGALGSARIDLARPCSF